MTERRTHVEGSIEAFVAACAARTPTPGGGAASAVFGAVGAALGAMAARFTIGKKGFEAHGPVLESAVATLDGLKDRLLPLVDADCAAYDAVSAAYALPKETPEQVEKRKAAIRAALMGALETPLAGARLCAAGLDAIAAISDRLNKNLASDAAVCALALRAALEGLSFNVRINAAALKDPPATADALAELERLRTAADRSRDITLKTLESAL